MFINPKSYLYIQQICGLSINILQEGLILAPRKANRDLRSDRVVSLTKHIHNRATQNINFHVSWSISCSVRFPILCPILLERSDDRDDDWTNASVWSNQIDLIFLFFVVCIFQSLFSFPWLAFQETISWRS